MGPARDGPGNRAATCRGRWPPRCPLACTGDPGRTLPLTLAPGLGLAVSAARYQTGDGSVPRLGQSAGPHLGEPLLPSRGVRPYRSCDVTGATVRRRGPLCEVGGEP